MENDILITFFSSVGVEINLSRVSIDDFDFGNDENEGRIQLDPSVWANPFNKSTPASNTAKNSNEMYGFYRNSDAILRQNISNSLPSPVRQQSTQPMAMPAMVSYKIAY